MALSKIDVSKMITGVTPLANGGTGGTSIPATNLASGVTGTLPVGSGGTGLTSGTTDQLLKFTGTTTLASSAITTGKVGQVLSTTAQNYMSTTSTSYVDTGTTIDITPTATSSKIYIGFDSGLCYEGNNYSNFYCYATIDRGGTNLGGAAGLTGIYCNALNSYNDYGFNFSMNYLDSPSTTSATTYKIQWRVNNAGAQIYYNLEGKSTITVMEILA